MILDMLKMILGILILLLVPAIALAPFIVPVMLSRQGHLSVDRWALLGVFFLLLTGFCSLCWFSLSYKFPYEGISDLFAYMSVFLFSVAPGACWPRSAIPSPRAPESVHFAL
jgi:hypothetical protein